MYDIEAVRAEWIGRSTAKITATYPVEHEPIRRHCLMVGNENPRYLTPGYVPFTPSPPTAIPIFAWAERLPPVIKPRVPVLDMGIPMLGSQFTNMRRECEFLLPVYVGDRLATQTRIVDMFQKSTRVDPKSLWIITEDVITNQDNVVVCTIRNTLLNFRTPAELKADGESVA